MLTAQCQIGRVAWHGADCLASETLEAFEDLKIEMLSFQTQVHQLSLC